MENVRGMLNKSEEIMIFQQILSTIKQQSYVKCKRIWSSSTQRKGFYTEQMIKIDVNEIRDELLSTKGDFIPISQALDFLPKLGNKEQKSAYLENDIWVQIYKQIGVEFNWE